MTQPPLNFGSRERKNAAVLAHVLHGALSDGQWHTAKAVKASTGLSDRAQRAIAEASAGQIISGQRGYRLIAFASIEEVDRAENWLRSQARAMLRRSLQIRRARNGRAA